MSTIRTTPPTVGAGGSVEGHSDTAVARALVVTPGGRRRRHADLAGLLAGGGTGARTAVEPDRAGLLADASTVTRTAVELDGPRATNGVSSTITDAGPAEVAAARQVTCG